MMYYTIYKIINTINQKYYIGMHRTSNIDDKYMGSGKLLANAYRKYGIQNFKKEILFIFDNEKEMYQKEYEIITEDVVNDPLSYNLKRGGVGMWGVSKEQRLRHGLNQRDNKLGIFSPEHFQKNINNPEWLKRYSFLNKERRETAYKNCWGNAQKKREIIDDRKKNGFQKGCKNSQFGTCWITKEGISKKLNLES